MRTFQAMRSIFTLLFLATSLHAQEADPKKAEEPIPQVKIRVKVLDPDGEPLEGAEVTPSGLRSRAEPGSHWRWTEKVHGPLRKARTNAEGVAELVYPKFLTEKLATGQVTWSVDHDDYVLFREDRSVDDELAELKLKSGYRIATTAVNAETRQPVRTDLYPVVSGGWASKWKVRNGGILTSRVFDRAQATMRVVHLPKDGPALFSDLKHISPEVGQNRVFLRDVELKRGTVVSGALDKSVPRPVKNGKVCLVIVVPGMPTPDTDARNGRGPSWNWLGSTKVERDGSFRFESLPTGDVAQMIAVCDGWVSKLPDGPKLKARYPELVTRDISARMRWPQLFKLNTPEIRPTISMERTATCEVTVQDSNGRPLVGARVAMWPNQIFFSWGSTILGDGIDFGHMLRLTRDGANARNLLRNRKSRYDAETNESGIAIIKNLPAPGDEGLVVTHDKFELPTSGRGDREANVVLEQGETTKLTIKLQPKGTETIGDE